MIDDLNDYNEDLMGHPQVISPNIKDFAKTAVSFKNAYSNDPMCGPSRSSMLLGVYPHNSSNFWQKSWLQNEVLSITKTIMEKFKENDYNVIEVGKYYIIIKMICGQSLNIKPTTVQLLI